MITPGSTAWGRLAALVVALSDRVPDAAALQPGMRLVEDVGLSSLMVVNLVLDLEREFGFVVREEDFDHAQTMADLAQLVERRLAEVQRGAPP
ncbi:MAG: acyl carrier protein [Betaproteobacteria bacterium]|nr:acyl carrier protein [Betaproteobacteria bacterium]